MTQVPMDELDPAERLATGGERVLLETFLDLYWEAITSKVSGLSEEEAILPPVPWSDEDPDADFRLEPGETVGQVIAEYDQECARSRAVAAERSLDDTGTHWRLGQVSLRWIYVHMIEETARHAGHADILREQTDGSTGV